MMNGFEQDMTSFYMAFAEQKLDAMCESLANMRLHVHNDRVEQKEGEEEASIRQEMLRACELKASSLQDVVLQQLKQMCATVPNVSLNELMDQFYLCIEVGAMEQAIPSFTTCLSSLFHTQANHIIDHVAACKQNATVNENGYIERNFYVEAMNEILTGTTDLMNAVADLVTPLEIELETTSTALQTILTPIQELCADVVQEILQLYAIDARMIAWERRAVDQVRSDQHLEVESDESLQMVDLLLDELSFLIRLLMSYDTFLTSLKLSMNIKSKIQELNGVYLILEQFYIRQSVHKATEIAEIHVIERQVVFVSSSVEDVTFILNKAFFRATQCLHYYTVLAVVIAIVDALDSMYLPSILNLPNRSFIMPSMESEKETIQDATEEVTTSFSDMLLAAVDDDLTKSIQEEAKLIMAINSSYLSGDFVEALQTKIEDYSKTTFPSETNLLECCPKPMQELVQAFRSIVEHEIDQALTKGIRKRLEPHIHRLMAERIEYELSSTQYDAYGLQGSPLNKFIERDVMQNFVLQRYQRALCIHPFYDLVEALVHNVTTWIEQALLQSQKRCNDLGALQLEREITAMLDKMSELVQQQRSLRPAFTRLFHIVLIINLFSPKDLLDYDVEELLSTFELHEIEHWLRMRIDFQSEEIQRTMETLKEKKT